MSTKRLLGGSLDISNLMEVYKYKRDFRKSHPEYFDPDGIICFCGPQGSGKTLSAVRYVTKMAERYEGLVCVSNVQLPNYPNPDNLYYFSGNDELFSYFKLQNGYAGIVYFIDEMPLLFNSLESKNMDIGILTEIAQQRKQRKHIVGTAQVFQRLAKPFREQFKYAVLCRCFFGAMQYNSLISGEHSTEDSNGKIQADTISRYFWFHTPELYDSYDTYAKIERVKIDGIGNSIVCGNG